MDESDIHENVQEKDETGAAIQTAYIINNTHGNSRKNIWDPLTKTLIDQTTWLIQKQVDDPCYTELPTLETVIRKLMEEGMAVVVGKPGEGKTALSFAVLHHFNNVYKVTAIKINSPKQMQQVVCRKRKCIILIDDIFGKSNFNRKLFDKWRPYFEDLYSYKGFERKDMQGIFILMAMRSNIFHESRPYMRSSKFSEHNIFDDRFVIDISENLKIHTNVKFEMINNYYECYKRKGKLRHSLSESSRQHISKVETPLGFPYLCKLFFENLEFYSKSVRFFQRPIDVLVENVKEMLADDKSKFIALCVVLLYSSDSCLPSHRLITADQTMKTLMQNLGVLVPDMRELRTNLQSLVGIFLFYNKPVGTYEFSHNSIRETVFIVAVEEYPQTVLELCGVQDLELVTVETSEIAGSEQKYILQRSQISFLYDRIHTEILENPLEILNLSLLNRVDFVSDIFNYFIENNNLQIILRKRYNISDVVKLTSRFDFEINSDSSSLILFSHRNPAFLLKILQYFIPENASKEWFRKELLTTLSVAMELDCAEVVKILLQNGAAYCMAPSLLSEKDLIRSEMRVESRRSRKAFSNVNESSFELLVYLAKESSILERKSEKHRHTTSIDDELMNYLAKLRSFQKWSPEKKEEALLEACRRENLTVVKFLLKHKQSVKDVHLEVVINSDNDSTEFFEYILTIHSLTHEWRTEALNVACRLGLLKRVTLLVDDGMDIDDKALLFSASSPKDNHEVVEFIHKSRMWNSSLTESALLAACMKGNVSVVSYFLEAGVKFCDSCLILGAYSPKPIPLYSIFGSIESTDWTEESIDKAVEIACAKFDLNLLECILSIKKTPRTLAIASKFPEEHGLEEFVSYLLRRYNWNNEDIELALQCACDQLNIAVFKLLKGHHSNI